jgi:hypothetical protein
MGRAAAASGRKTEKAHRRRAFARGVAIEALGAAEAGVFGEDFERHGTPGYSSLPIVE